jgi:hypothetical protein
MKFILFFKQDINHSNSAFKGSIQRPIKSIIFFMHKIDFLSLTIYLGSYKI